MLRASLQVKKPLRLHSLYILITIIIIIYLFVCISSYLLLLFLYFYEMELPSSGSQTPFRLMNDDDIRQFLLIAFDFKLDRDAFTRPTREMVFNIYKKFVTALPCKDVDQPNLQAAQQMDDLGLYLDFVPYMNLTCEIRKILRGWDNQMFQTSDILEPKRKRTQHFLTVLITVWGYIYDDVYPKWQAISKEKSRLQLRDRKIKCEKELIEAKSTIEEVAMKISNLEANHGSGDDIDRCLREYEDIAIKKKNEKEELRKKLNEIKLDIAKMKETKSDIKLATNKLKERKKESEKMATDYEELTRKYHNEVEIKKSLQNRTKAVNDMLQIIEDLSNWDIKQHENSLAALQSAYKDSKNPLMIKTIEVLEQLKSTKSLISDKKSTIELNKAQITEKSKILKIQLEELEIKRQAMTDEKEAIKSKVELALGGFEKTMDESIDIVNGPLKSLKVNH